MIRKPISSAKLRAKVKAQYIKTKRLGDLARAVGLSKPYLSMWYHGKATWDTTEIESRLSAFFHSQETLSFADEKILTSILLHLDDANKPDTIIAVLNEYERPKEPDPH